MSCCRPFAATAEIDAAAWAGVVAMTRGATNITLPSTTWYRSPLAMLNNYGMPAGRDMQTDLTAVGTGGGVWTIGIDSTTGYLYVENSLMGFTLTPTGTDSTKFGFGPAAVAVNAVNTSGTIYRATATAAPTPGVIQQAHLQLDPTGVGAAFYVPSIAYRAQSVWTLLRTGEAGTDADNNNNTSSVQYVDNNAMDNASRRITWGISDTGKTWVAWPSTITPSNPAFPSAGVELQRLLGFKGGETPSTIAGTISNLRVIESTYYNLAALVTTRVPQRIKPVLDEETQGVRLTSGELVTNNHLSRRGYEVEIIVDGEADSRDLRQHAIEFFRRCTQGKILEAHMCWGDPRRAVRNMDVISTSATGQTRPAYSTLYTSAGNGLRGRLVTRRSLDDDSHKVLGVDSGLQRRIPLTLILESAEAGI